VASRKQSNCSWPSDARLKVIAENFRDWGRDYWCPSVIVNTYRVRSKYTYNLLCYNPKRSAPRPPSAGCSCVTCRSSRDSQAELGNAAPWPGYPRRHVRVRYAQPCHRLKSEYCFFLDATDCRTDSTYFGFKIAVKPDGPFSLTELAQELDLYQIGNSMLFGGNLLRQPVCTASLLIKA